MAFWESIIGRRAARCYGVLPYVSTSPPRFRACRRHRHPENGRETSTTLAAMARWPLFGAFGIYCALWGEMGLPGALWAYYGGFDVRVRMARKASVCAMPATGGSR